jgi:ABC-type transport system substrate-binding protein
MKKFRSTPIALGLTALSLTACVNSSPEGEATDSEIINAGIETFVNVEDATEFLPTWSKENTVVYHMIGDPDDMHPANGNSATRSFIHGYTQSYVMASDLINLKGGRPDVVKGHPTVSADELQFTYELMDEPTWDNGEQLTVADVIFTFKAIKCPLTNNPHAKALLGKPENNYPRFCKSTQVYFGNEEKVHPKHCISYRLSIASRILLG